MLYYIGEPLIPIGGYGNWTSLAEKNYEKTVARLEGESTLAESFYTVVTKRYPEEMDYVTLYPISDVHLGARNCREEEFREYIARIEQDDSAVVVLAGDIINNGIIASKTDVYAERYTPEEQKELAIEILSPIASKVIACVAGNHEYRTVKSVCQDVMKDIAHRCGFHKVYGRDAVFLKLQVGKKKNHQPAAYMIYVSHGSGGGSLLGGAANKQDKFQMSVEGLDISITGHTHKPLKAHSGRLVFDPQHCMVTERNTLVFVCTAWLNYGDYAVRQQYAPAAFYPDTIRLDGRKKEWK